MVWISSFECDLGLEWTLVKCITHASWTGELVKPMFN